jgi:hypothetical protein
MARSGIVPAVGTLVGDMVEPLDQGDMQGRIKLAQDNPERGAHYAPAYQDYIRGGRHRTAFLNRWADTGLNSNRLKT